MATTTKKATSKKAATKTAKKGGASQAADKAATAPAASEAPTTVAKAPSATRANDAAKGGKRAKAPATAPKVEILTEAEAKARGGMIEILKTLKGQDPAIRFAAKAGGFVIGHEDGRYSAAKTAEPAKAAEAAATQNARAEAERNASQDGMAASERAMAATAKPNRKSAGKPAKGCMGAKAAKTLKEPKPKQMSALDAAAQVLTKAKKPMRAKELIEAMAKQGLWSSPAGRTPEATLYAAMVREISKKGKDARFRTHDRGAFIATGKGG